MDAEDDTSPKSDLKGDFYDVKNSARKNKANHMEFDSGKPFMSGKSAVTIQVDRLARTNNVATLKLNLLKLHPVPSVPTQPDTQVSPKDGVVLTACKSPREGSSRNRQSNQPLKMGST